MNTTLLRDAVYHSRAASKQGALERLFTLWFQRLVYNQIWEDPRVDLAALRLAPDSRLLTIASAGCNVLNYLAADPAAVVAVDLNPAHLALTRLKLAALAHLPRHGSFYRMFGTACDAGNVRLYDRYLRDRLDEETRAFWEARTPFGRRRIHCFADGLYRSGVSGRYIGLLHALVRLRGLEPSALLAAPPEERERLFDRHIAPLFDNPIVRWLCEQPAALYSVGIPLAQYRALQADANDGVAGLIRDRVRRLACGFPIEENYFAWQAFGRRYGGPDGRALPDYLREANFATLRQRAGRVQSHFASLADLLERAADGSFDRYVLLDAQDWMNDGQLRRLWRGIERTARPGARAIFRTAAAASPLETALPADLLARWRPQRDLAAELHAADRSAIYGGFHVYARRD